MQLSTSAVRIFPTFGLHDKDNFTMRPYAFKFTAFEVAVPGSRTLSLEIKPHQTKREWGGGAKFLTTEASFGFLGILVCSGLNANVRVRFHKDVTYTGC